MDIITLVLEFLSEPWMICILVAGVFFGIGVHIDDYLLTRLETKIGTMVIVSGLFGLVLMLVFSFTAYWTGTSLDLEISTKKQAIGIGILEILWVIPYLYANE